MVTRQQLCEWGLLLACGLAGCVGEEAPSQIEVASADDDARERDAEDRTDDEDSADDDSVDDDSADDDSADDDSGEPEQSDPAPASEAPQAEPSATMDEPGVETVPATPEVEDEVVFGGGSVVVVVEPVPEPVATVVPEPEPEPAEPLVECAGASGTGTGVLIDDMEDADLEALAQDARTGSWFYYDDATGGSHTLLIDPVDAGAPGSTLAVHVSGGDFTEWGSGFGVGLRWAGEGGERCVYDASHYTGLRFWTKGNGTPVRAIAMNPTVIPVSEGGTCPEDGCWDNHGVAFVPTEVWTEVFIPFASLAQRWTEPPLAFDPTRIYTLEFTLDAGVTYDVWIDDIGFYREGEMLPAYDAAAESEMP